MRQKSIHNLTVDSFLWRKKKNKDKKKKWRLSFTNRQKLAYIRRRTKKRIFLNRKRSRLLAQYRVPIYVRFQHNNLFASVYDSERQAMVHKTVGQLEDYKKQKKKKKTYMAGFEFGYLVQDLLKTQKVKTVACVVHGQGAHFKGFYQGMVRRKNVKFTKFRQVSPIAHGGTRATRRRRL